MFIVYIYFTSIIFLYSRIFYFRDLFSLYKDYFDFDSVFVFV